MRATGRTKIIATLGPASESPEVLGRMLDAGVDVVRFNFSHGSPADHLRRLAAARQSADERGLPLAALQDLPGPKLRVGSLPGGQMALVGGQEISLASGQAGATGGVIPVAYAHLAEDMKV